MVLVVELQARQVALMQPKATIENEYYVRDVMYSKSIPAEPYVLVPNGHPAPIQEVRVE